MWLFSIYYFTQAYGSDHGVVHTVPLQAILYRYTLIICYIHHTLFMTNPRTLYVLQTT